MQLPVAYKATLASDTPRSAVAGHIESTFAPSTPSRVGMFQGSPESYHDFETAQRFVEAFAPSFSNNVILL